MPDENQQVIDTIETESNLAEYREQYSEDAFWAKAGRFAVFAGRHVMQRALQLYYASKRSETPAWAKATILGALGYFIMPLDAISDFTPVVGFSDDLGVMVFALAVVAAHIDDDVIAKADERLRSWFPTPELPEPSDQDD
ncbi:MAG: YkvA family protein [bacterium]|nr:YkvA family protein [bacterium]